MTKASIDIGIMGRNAKIVLDGTDVSSAVREFTLTGSVNDITRLDLVLLPRATTVEAEVRVVIDDAAARILEAAGWTAPGNCAMGCR